MIIHFYDRHCPTTGGHFIKAIGVSYLSTVSLPAFTFQSQEWACCCSKEHIHPCFSGEDSMHENVAWLNWLRIRTKCPRQGKTWASATEFYRNRCNKQPHHTCTVIQWTVGSTLWGKTNGVYEQNTDKYDRVLQAFHHPLSSKKGSLDENYC